MTTKPIERLLFAQGGSCFFCEGPLSAADASVEHLVARTNGGGNSDENCVACCKSLNSLFGQMSLKEKLRVVLAQNGPFRCPNGGPRSEKKTQRKQPSPLKKMPTDRLSCVLSDLKKRGNATPKTVESLANAIDTLFKKELNDEEIHSLIGQLESSGRLTIVDRRVSYAL